MRFGLEASGGEQIERAHPQGFWVYLYRAVDRAGWTVDFFLSRNRDVNAAKTFLRNAIKNRRHQDHAGRPRGITSRSQGNEGGRRASAPGEGAIEPIL